MYVHGRYCPLSVVVCIVVLSTDFGATNFYQHYVILSTGPCNTENTLQLCNRYEVYIVN